MACHTYADQEADAEEAELPEWHHRGHQQGRGEVDGGLGGRGEEHKMLDW